MAKSLHNLAPELGTGNATAISEQLFEVGHDLGRGVVQRNNARTMLWTGHSIMEGRQIFELGPPLHGSGPIPPWRPSERGAMEYGKISEAIS